MGRGVRARRPGQEDTGADPLGGGPFPYPRNDGVVFENREGHLPKEPSSYYHEYTVVTPGTQDRGPRRIITGSQGEKYFTADHYDSFQRIREGT